MPNIPRTDFLVLGCQEQCFSLKVLGGTNAGKTIDIPNSHAEYPQDIEEQLCTKIQEGMILNATLMCTEDDSETIWLVKDLHDCSKP